MIISLRGSLSCEAGSESRPARLPLRSRERPECAGLVGTRVERFRVSPTANGTVKDPTSKHFLLLYGRVLDDMEMLCRATDLLEYPCVKTGHRCFSFYGNPEEKHNGSGSTSHVQETLQRWENESAVMILLIPPSPSQRRRQQADVLRAQPKLDPGKRSEKGRNEKIALVLRAASNYAAKVRG